MNFKVIYLSLFSAFLLFITTLAIIGGVAISYDSRQFTAFTSNYERIKQKVVMLGLLTESELIKNEGKSIESIISKTNHSFNESIISSVEGSGLDYVEVVARKVLHDTENYVSSVFYDKDHRFYFRSYETDKMIFDHPSVEVFDADNFLSLEWCKKTYACVEVALKDQLLDRVLISKPYQVSNNKTWSMSVVSPVYYKGVIVGEFGEQISMRSIIESGKSLNVSISQGQKILVIDYGNYPWKNFSYSNTYVADNNNLIVFRLPFSKIIIDYSPLYFVFFMAMLIYYIKHEESKHNKIELETARVNATEDELTGLLNRKVFNSIEFNKRIISSGYSVVAIDGDRIKLINDKYGHHIGDEAIVSIANAMKEVFRSTDFLIRTGGDEFLAVLPGCSLSKAKALSRKLRDIVANNRLNQLEIGLDVSVGVVFQDQGEKLEDVIIRADEELYDAKRRRA